ncbi:saccharopine dehydrogenase NADP-binding domain-containing protein [Mesorhizobium sp. M0633]
MKIAVLGGLGLQGRAAIADLVASDGVEQVVCLDTATDGAARLGGLTDLARVRFVVPEGAIGPALAYVMKDVDAVIDLLPQPLMREAVQAAIATRTPLVTTNYGKAIADLAPRPKRPAFRSSPNAGSTPASTLCSTRAPQASSTPSPRSIPTAAAFPSRRRWSSRCATR